VKSFLVKKTDEILLAQPLGMVCHTGKRFLTPSFPVTLIREAVRA
jgi:hypothetical protein